MIGKDEGNHNAGEYPSYPKHKFEPWPPEGPSNVCANCDKFEDHPIHSHVLGCVEYHQHTSPKCCDLSCWCFKDALQQSDRRKPEISVGKGLVTSSPAPSFRFITTHALIRLAERCELGFKRKGDKAWNALTNNQAVLTDKEAVLNRIEHVIYHALKLRDKLAAGGDPLAGDDDAGALIWGGYFLCEATHALSEEYKRSHKQ